ANSADFAPGLAQERIVKGRNQWSVSSQGLLHLRADRPEELVLIKMFLGIEPIVSGPVLLGAVLQPQQAGDGVSAKADHMRKQVPTRTLQGLSRGTGRRQILDQLFDLWEECGVFFRSIGLGGTTSRERMRCPLSAIVH